MEFLERSFVSDASYRPRPFIYYNKDNCFIIALTYWGDVRKKEELVSRIESYILSAQTDNELTSPYQPLSSYNKIQNAIRISVLMINDYLLKEQNSREYLGGLELFIGFKKDNEFYFVNYGHPHLLISKHDKSIMPIKLDLDFSLDLSVDKLLPALPSHLIGINSQIDFTVESLKIHKDDQLILLSRSWIPDKLLTLKDTERNLDAYVNCLSKVDEQPFWIGVISF